ncbi:beta strand repeat-containing protein [Jannaschia ovalis]|uniref:Uncharacterized protein n=1 Tax=Jannaschia ovalis TaxID=3038773 RepID=A0ABY8LBY9_9RHOB|nr:hypothetical protein [Jannaschia sp. GRR-S6-38]WGH78137.1 hypothetical protein P8627_14035 [Jannaschia sp. GRR-S6-38]
MKKFLTTTAIASALAFPAAADDTDIDQTISALQTALNSILINFDGTGVSQAATNAANLINYTTDDLDDVNQTAGPIAQIGINSLISTEGGFDDVEQTGVNVVNSFQAPEVEDLNQSLVLGLQTATNSIEAATGTNMSVQNATNAANVATVDVDIENDLTQTVLFAAQSASNAIDTGGDITDATQAATNVANSATVGDDVSDDVAQTALLFGQTATNELDATFNINVFDQDAINAVNLLETVDDASDFVDQIAGGVTQTASNDAFAFFGNISAGAQDAVNVANSVTIGDDISDDLTQLFDSGSQAATNVADAVFSISDTPQTATNAANLASFSEVGGFISQTFVDSTQTATNDLLLVIGTATGSNQAATNVANSLTGLADDVIVDEAEQIVEDATQVASNTVAGSPIGNPNQNISVTGVSGMTQTATNAANIADIGTIEDELLQSISGTGQLATNVVEDVDPASGGISDLTQAATNVANSVEVDEVEEDLFGPDELIQTADMSGPLNGQAALNFVEFGIDGVTDVSQTATNAVNLATIGEMNSTMSQTVTGGAQLALNLVNYAGSTAPGDPLGFDSAGTVTNLTQTAVNAGNLLTVGSLADIVGAQEVTQTFSGLQVAGNGLYDADTINSVTQAATNVANSISNPTP